MSANFRFFIVFAQLFVVCLCGGYEYSAQTEHFYKFHVSPVMNWTEARQTCAREGAYLAVPNSDAEATVLMGLHARHTNAEITNTEWPDWVSVGIFWDNGWKTVDGQTLESSGYSRWFKSYPGTDRSYPYVVMNRRGELSTTRSVKYPFVCEIDRELSRIHTDLEDIWS